MNINFAFAEIIIVCSAMLGLVIDAFINSDKIRKLIRSSYMVILIIVSGYMLYQLPQIENKTIFLFGTLFIATYYTFICKIVLTLTVVIVIWLIQDHNSKAVETKIEFSTLILLSLTGLMLMISASDLLGVFLGLELSALPAYILAAFKRNQVKSAEAGLKYILLGAISTAIYIYGVSLVYGSTASTFYIDIREALADITTLSIGTYIGIMFILVSIAFKIAAAPFHMWSPDVYEGSPTIAVTYFATAAKFGAFILFSILCLRFFLPIADELQLIIQLLAAISMIIGSIGALVQENLKRLIAYSSITHSGFILMGLAGLNITAGASVLYYLVLYIIMLFGAFAIVSLMNRDNLTFSNINSLSGIFRFHPLFSFSLLLIMFSLAGIPPFGGFFAKYSVFYSALQAQLYPLAIIGALSSVVAAFYYLRIVKIVFFDKANQPLDKMPKRAFATLVFSGLIMLFFAFYNQPLLSISRKASQALFFE